MLANKKIVVTGGSGFLGKHVVELLKATNEVFIPRSKDYNLMQPEAARKIFSDFGKTDIVIHVASDVGGIGYSKLHPGEQYYNNTLINLNIVHEAYQAGVGKFVGIGSACEYPAEMPVPFNEEELWNGYPAAPNDSYALTKRMLLAQCNAYRKQYDFNSIHLLPTNLYGPYDNFDADKAQVIPALICKIKQAIDQGQSVVKVWGTGYETREFIYVADAAEAIVLAAEKYNKPEPVNIGSGAEVQIRSAANLIKGLLGYEGDFLYLDNGLGGQQRRVLDVGFAKKEFGFKAKTNFEEGLQTTIDYYVKNQRNLT